MAQLQVANRKSQEMLPGATLLGIGVLVYWYIGDRAKALHTGLKSCLQKAALQNNAPKPFTIHHSSFTIKNLPTTHLPRIENFIIARNSKC
ncbi:hypothetical protein [Nitratifractor sp.]